jgi:hypothetical protein
MKCRLDSGLLSCQTLLVSEAQWAFEVTSISTFLRLSILNGFGKNVVSNSNSSLAILPYPDAMMIFMEGSLATALRATEHTKTRAHSPQTNDICEGFHKTILQEFCQVAFRRKIYRTIEELQSDLDAWLAYYNFDRTHQGKRCCGRTPMQTLLDAGREWNDKITTLNS